MCFFVTVNNPISVDEDFAFGKISLGGAICIATKFLLMRHLQAKKKVKICLRFRLTVI